MTDEEMAEEWVRQEYPTLEINAVAQRYIKAFLAGLKAKIQWHDLREDPNDLPDEGFYLVVWQNARGYRETMMLKFEEDDEEKLHWVDGDNDYWDEDVIAWCELPKFEE